MLFLINISYGQGQQLTKEQKIKDFNYVYNILKENYPFWGMHKRKHEIDWLAKKKEYIAKIEATNNDSEYIFSLKKIIGDLNDGHINFNATRFGNQGYYSLYKKAAKENPNYTKWVEMFENTNVKLEYWSDILEDLENEKDSTSPKKTIKKQVSNYTDTIVSNGTIAIMSILSFNYHLINKDKNEINDFLKQIKKTKCLIIDIQENSGGSHDYWINNIVARLIRDTIKNKSYPIIKEGNINRHFYQDFFAKAKLINETDSFPNIPTELKQENYYVDIWIDTIAPNNSINYNGEIYLLVSETVFSASEAFAQFCKTTSWATVAGERTGGDGIGSDPAIIMLPESGILMNFPSLVGLNHDGSLNSEEKTTPDIIIEAANSQQRLERLINYLNDDK